MADRQERGKNWKLSAALAAGIVLFILVGLTFGGGGPSTTGKIEATMALMQALDAASASYVTDNGPLPKNLDNHTFWSDISGADSGKVYISFKTSQMNDKGEVVDSWGTPIQVTVADNGLLRMRSAGGDKIFGTSDDITSE